MSLIIKYLLSIVSGAVRNLVTGKTVGSVAHPATGLKVVWFGPRLNKGIPPKGNGPAYGNIACNIPTKVGRERGSVLQISYTCKSAKNTKICLGQSVDKPRG